MLADYGADVIVVEPPDEDGRRSTDPAGFSVWNRGKRSVALDLRRDRADIVRLLGSADLVIESFGPEGGRSLRLGYEDLHPQFPSVVWCSFTAVGLDGPHSDLPPYEPLVHAVAGTMAEQLGHRDGPIFESIPFASIGAAHLALIGSLAALYRRSVDGMGRRVETSLLDGALAYMAMYWADSDANPSGQVSTSARSTGYDAGTRLISQMYRCADGKYLGVGTAALGAFGKLMRVMGLAALVPPTASLREVAIKLTPDEHRVVREEVPRLFASESSRSWERRLVAGDVCAIPVLEPGAIFDDPQTQLNQMVVTVDDPQLGRVEQVAGPIRFFDAGPPAPLGAPLHGEHTDTVLRSLDQQREQFLVGNGPVEDTPVLDGLRIADLGAFIAGPFSTRLLADLGADVVKVEAPEGEAARGMPRIFRPAQAGKRCLAIDLKDPACRPAVDALLRWADVVHHNLRPRVARDLGLAHDQLRAAHPDVVVGVAPGWGSEGPNADRQSFEPHMSGYAGAAYEVAGRHNDPLYPICNSDMGNGLIGAVAILIGLLRRAASGDGTSYENCHLNAAMVHMAHVVRRSATEGHEAEVIGAHRLDPLQYGFSAFERLYRTADGWLCLVVRTSAEAAALEAVVGVRLEWSPVRPVDEHGECDESLAVMLEDVFAKRTTGEWLAALRRAGVAAVEPVGYNAAAFLRDPENRRTGRVVECADPVEGRVRELSRFVRVMGTPVVAHRLAPSLGADTEELLTSLGYDETSIAELAERGAIRLGGSPRGHER